MSTLPVAVKHGAKKHSLELDADKLADGTLDGRWLKERIQEMTSVPAAKVKVLVKGGQLKDDVKLSTLSIKPGHVFTAIGAAEALPPPPTEKIKFSEDMTDGQLAEATKIPAGLENLGNTCYMNSCVQVLRTIPELQTALNGFDGTIGSNTQTAASVTAGLRDLFRDLGKTTEGMPPFIFWNLLRNHVPQFQEMREGHPAQQDAEECWTQILQAVKQTLPGGSNNTFVSQYMTGQMTTETKCVEAPDEPPTTQTESFTDLKCHISSATNYQMNGIKDSLDSELEKTSPSLGRSAVYKSQSRLSRLPAYLTVHQVRFFFRRDIGKKTKVLRQVKFTFELDAAEIVTPDLQKRIRPVNQAMREVAKDRAERAKVRRRTKIQREEERRAAHVPGSSSAAAAAAMDVDPSSSTPGASSDPEAEEKSLRAKEKERLQGLLDQDLVKDTGSNPTGVYELWGIVTHKGASADGGHYISWCRAAASGAPREDDPEKELWYKFDDDRVSTVDRNAIEQLAGGGEGSAAFLLLYRAVSLD